MPAVKSRTISAHPANPAGVESWIVLAGVTGAWAGKTDAIAVWHDGAWTFLTARVGWAVHVEDERQKA